MKGADPTCVSGLICSITGTASLSSTKTRFIPLIPCSSSRMLPSVGFGGFFQGQWSASTGLSPSQDTTCRPLRDGQKYIFDTKYPSNKCIDTIYKILVPENVTKYNTCILYLKYRKYFFWIFHFLTIWYSRVFRFGLYNVHKALVNHTWLA